MSPLPSDLIAALTDRGLVRWIIDAFEGHEFTNRRTDRGGPTRHGVTQRLLSSFMGRSVSSEEVRQLSLDLAVEILYSEFCFKPRLYEIGDPLVKLCAIDFAVHSGAPRAVRSVQYAVFQKPPYDGVFGPQTQAAVHAARPDQVRREMLAYRIRFIGKLTRLAPTQAANAEGWANRIATLLELEPDMPLPRAA